MSSVNETVTFVRYCAVLPGVVTVNATIGGASPGAGAGLLAAAAVTLKVTCSSVVAVPFRLSGEVQYVNAIPTPAILKTEATTMMDVSCHES